MKCPSCKNEEEFAKVNANIVKCGVCGNRYNIFYHMWDSGHFVPFSKKEDFVDNSAILGGVLTCLICFLSKSLDLSFIAILIIPALSVILPALLYKEDSSGGSYENNHSVKYSCNNLSTGRLDSYFGGKENMIKVKEC